MKRIYLLVVVAFLTAILLVVAASSNFSSMNHRVVADVQMDYEVIEN